MAMLHHLTSGDNTFMLGGLVLVIVQSLSRMLENSVYYIAQYFFRLVFVTVDIDNTQEAHTWLTSYLSALHAEGKITTWGTLSILNDLSSTKLDRSYHR
jgi:hypothetical protein